MYEDLQERAEAILDERRFVEYCVRRAESLAAAEAAIAVRTKIPAGRVQEILADLVRRQIIFSLAAKGYIHRDTAAEAGERILDLVGDFHRQSPESPGLPLEQLRQAMPIDKAVLDGLLARLKSEGRLVERNQRLALPEHRSTFGDEDAKLLEAIEALFRDKGFRPPEPGRSRAADGRRRRTRSRRSSACCASTGGWSRWKGACFSTARPWTAPAKSWSRIFAKRAGWKACNSSIFSIRRGSSPCRCWTTWIGSA